MFPRLFALNLWWWPTEANAKTRFQRSRVFAYQCTTGVEAASFAEQNSRLPPELVSVGLRNSPNFPYRRGMVVLEDIYGCPL